MSAYNASIIPVMMQNWLEDLRRADANPDPGPAMARRAILAAVQPELLGC